MGARASIRVAALLIGALLLGAAALVRAPSAGASPAGGASPIAPASGGGGGATTITVYRRSIATICGPGFWGRRTACGQTLRPGTLGVANRTLKCGTPVAILSRGRTMIVPVIDRGPDANHADWDLTAASARALGITQTTRIAAAPLPDGR